MAVPTCNTYRRWRPVVGVSTTTAAPVRLPPLRPSRPLLRSVTAGTLQNLTKPERPSDPTRPSFPHACQRFRLLRAVPFGHVSGSLETWNGGARGGRQPEVFLKAPSFWKGGTARPRSGGLCSVVWPKRGHRPESSRYGSERIPLSTVLSPAGTDGGTYHMYEAQAGGSWVGIRSQCTRRTVNRRNAALSFA